MNSNKSDALDPDLVVQAYGIDRACGRAAPRIRPQVSLPPPQAPGGVVPEWPAFGAPSGVPVVM